MCLGRLVNGDGEDRACCNLRNHIAPSIWSHRGRTLHHISISSPPAHLEFEPSVALSPNVTQLNRAGASHREIDHGRSGTHCRLLRGRCFVTTLFQFKSRHSHAPCSWQHPEHVSTL